MVELHLHAFVDHSVDREGNDLNAVYARVAREIFDDGVVYWGRIVAFFALTIYFKRHFDIELEKKVIDFVEEFFPDWMANCHLPGGWDIISDFLQTLLSFHSL